MRATRKHKQTDGRLMIKNVRTVTNFKRRSYSYFVFRIFLFEFVILIHKHNIIVKINNENYKIWIDF